MEDLRYPSGYWEPPATQEYAEPEPCPSHGYTFLQVVEEPRFKFLSHYWRCNATNPESGDYICDFECPAMGVDDGPDPDDNWVRESRED